MTPADDPVLVALEAWEKAAADVRARYTDGLADIADEAWERLLYACCRAGYPNNTQESPETFALRHKIAALTARAEQAEAERDGLRRAGRALADALKPFEVNRQLYDAELSALEQLLEGGR